MNVSPELERLLRDRAHKLAARDLAPRARPIFADVVVVRRERSLFAVRIDDVTEIRRVRVTRLPHARPHVAGVFAAGGHLHALCDLLPFVAATAPLAHGMETLALLGGAPARAIALRVDDVVGARTIYVDELDPSRRERNLPFVEAVTADCVEILDLTALMSSPELRMEASGSRWGRR